MKYQFELNKDLLKLIHFFSFLCRCSVARHGTPHLHHVLLHGHLHLSVLTAVVEQRCLEVVVLNVAARLKENSVLHLHLLRHHLFHHLHLLFLARHLVHLWHRLLHLLH